MSNAKLLAPGDPTKSIVARRVESLAQLYRMPPIGTSIRDDVGLADLNEWISLIDVCEVAADSDNDMVRDNVDNCTALPNASQADTDGDGYGNRCDGDLNNDGSTNRRDQRLLDELIINNDHDAVDADFDQDGLVTLRDQRHFMRYLIGQPPGPSALSPAP
ncbi:unnamed protein product [marine sediment metagenome]|uniref:Dockerin domain-containing protein n=1 Tax=marine sediment metagenome TaxID=412755 RepID=X1CN27_9ZZZZ